MNNKAFKRISFEYKEGKRSSISIDMSSYLSFEVIHGEEEAMKQLKTWAVEAHKNNKQGAGRSTSREVQSKAAKEVTEYITKHKSIIEAHQKKVQRDKKQIAKSIKKKPKSSENDEGMSM